MSSAIKVALDSLNNHIQDTQSPAIADEDCRFQVYIKYPGNTNVLGPYKLPYPHEALTSASDQVLTFGGSLTGPEVLWEVAAASIVSSS